MSKEKSAAKKSRKHISSEAEKKLLGKPGCRRRNTIEAKMKVRKPVRTIFGEKASQQIMSCKRNRIKAKRNVRKVRRIKKKSYLLKLS